MGLGLLHYLLAVDRRNRLFINLFHGQGGGGPETISLVLLPL